MTRSGRVIRAIGLGSVLFALPVVFPLPVAGGAAGTSSGSAGMPEQAGGAAGTDLVAADTLRLTLDEAIRRARGSNPSYRQSSNDMELNRIERRSAWLSILPQPNLTLLNTSMNWQRQTIVEDNFGEPLVNPEAAMVQTSRSNQTANLSFSFNFGNILNLREQETQADLRQTSFLQGQLELETGVAQAFFDAQERRLTVELEEELLGNAEVNLDAARQLYRLARRDRMDLLAAELDLAEQENALEDARFEQRNAMLSLRNLIGDLELRDFELVEAPLRIFDPAYLDEEELVAIALRQAPPVLQQESTIESARRQVSQSRADWLPTVNLFMSTGRQEFVRDSGSAFFQPMPDGDWSRNVGFTVSFPDVGQYFQRQNTARTRQIQVANAEEQMRQVRMELDQNIRSLLVNLHSAFRSVRLQERRVELASEQLDLRLDSYRLGRADFSDLQAATEAAAQARRQALQARYSFERARISLERSLGMTLQVPVDAVIDAHTRDGEN